MTDEQPDDNQPATKRDLRLTKRDLRLEIGELRTEFGQLRASLENRIDESSAETRRHMSIIAEGLRDEMRVLADGIAAKTDAIDQLTNDQGKEGNRRAMLELRVDDHERRIRKLESR